MFTRIRSIFAAMAVFTVAGFMIVATQGGANAVTVCAPLTTTDHSYVSPIHGGQALNASNWGGGGTKAAACTGEVTNDLVKTWGYPGASVASDFTPEPVGTSTTLFQLVYTPGNQVNVANPLCVSTVLDQLHAYARLRPCAGLTVSVDGGTGNATLNQVGTNGNQWQDFTFVSEGDGFFQIKAATEAFPGPFSLNIAGYGGNGTQVISWNPLTNDNCGTTGCGQNEIFELRTAS